MSHPDSHLNHDHPCKQLSRGRILALCMSLGVFLVAGSCAVLPPKIDIPTLMPEEEIPTAIALTSQALLESTPYPTRPLDGSPTFSPPGTDPPLETSVATADVDPSPTVPNPPTPILITPSPTATYALEDLSPATLPVSLPYGTIQILNPGPLSKIISPIRLHAYLHPGTDDRVRVVLYGEDGRVLAQRIIRYDAPRDTKVYLELDLRFEIPGVAETARLEITTRDDYGRLIALASTDIILLTEGDTDVNPPTDLYEKIVIEEPLPDILIQGGKIIVKGYTRCTENDRLYVEIVNYQGDVVGSKYVGISEKELDLGYHFYAGEVPYDVGSAGTWVRVQISALDDDLSGVIHTSSVRVLVSP